MPEHLKALVFILTLSTVVFAVAKAPATAVAMTSADFVRRRNLWFALILVVFLAHNFWVYIIASAILLYAVQRGERNALALYFFVLLAVPPIPREIPGLGIVNYLFEIEYVRLLILTILLPAYLSLRQRPDTVPFGRMWADRLLAGILVVDFLLMFEHRTFTHVLREGCFNAFVDTFLPYYVASRGLRRLEEFRDALMSLAVAAMALSAVLFLEFWWHWLLYEGLERALGVAWGWNAYVVRGSNVRAAGPIGHPLVAGYVVAIAFGFHLYLRKVVASRTMWVLGFLLLSAGLIAPLSRGPWVGAALMVLAFIATGAAPVAKLTKLGLAGMVVFPLLLLTPYGSRIIDYLPFVGSVDAQNIAFRQTLAQVSYNVFMENPILGSRDFVNAPAMQALRGDDGNVDLVNTYVVFALSRGAVGLALFLCFFGVVIAGIIRAMRRVTDRTDERYVLGQALLAVLLGVLAIVATVAPVLRVPLLYWGVAGLGVAYAGMLRQAKPASVAPDDARAATGPARFDGARGLVARVQGGRR